MALVTTTNSSAIAADDNSIVVASATDVAAGRWVKVNDEFMLVRKDYTSGTTVQVLRGQMGTVRKAHAVTSNVTHGTGEDFANALAQSTLPYPRIRAREMRSYGAAGAITLPTPGNDMVAVINGTSAFAMTLANPTKDQDGDVLIIIGNGKAAHTVTYTAGLGDGGSGVDVATFPTGGRASMMLMAVNAIWVPLPSPFEGVVTAIDVSLA